MECAKRDSSLHSAAGIFFEIAEYVCFNLFQANYFIIVWLLWEEKYYGSLCQNQIKYPKQFKSEHDIFCLHADGPLQIVASEASQFFLAIFPFPSANKGPPTVSEGPPWPIPRHIGRGQSGPGMCSTVVRGLL